MGGGGVKNYQKLRDVINGRSLVTILREIIFYATYLLKCADPRKLTLSWAFTLLNRTGLPCPLHKKAKFKTKQIHIYLLTVTYEFTLMRNKQVQK